MFLPENLRKIDSRKAAYLASDQQFCSNEEQMVGVSRWEGVVYHDIFYLRLVNNDIYIHSEWANGRNE